jgi:putative ABC transport system substrate-binding protein
MDRRAFLVLLSIIGSAAARPSSAGPGKALGWLTFTGSGEGDLISDTLSALGKLGWKRGESLQLTRSVPVKPSEIEGAAEELVIPRPDLIVANGEAAITAIRARSSTQPVLFYNACDPVRTGLVHSLAQPGPHTTGLIGYPLSLGPKWVQLLHILMPAMSRVAVVFEPTLPSSSQFVEAIRNYGGRAQIVVVNWPAEHFGSANTAAQAFSAPYPDAIIVLPDPTTFRVRRDITQFAQQRKIPAMFWYADAVRANAFISYGPDRTDLPGRLATRIDRILRGATPSSIPVEEPSRYELAINRLIASQFGIEIPALLAAQADVFVD